MQELPDTGARPEASDSTNGSERKAQRRWLLLARGGWIALTLLVLVINVLSIPTYYRLLQSVCEPGAVCAPSQLGPEDLRLLHEWRVTPGALAAFSVGLTVSYVVVFCALGALLFWRHSHHRMALFCAYTLVLFVSTTASFGYGLAMGSSAWYGLYGVLDILSQVAFTLFLCLFPSGRFVPRWIIYGVLLEGALWIYNVFFSNVLLLPSGPGPGWSNVLTVTLLLLGVGAQVYRYLRVSTQRERQQTKWVVYGLAVALIGFALFTAMSNLLLSPVVLQSTVGNLLLNTGGGLFTLAIPVSIVVAILRSQLWDIDALINKTLVYGLLTGLLGSLYVVLVIGLERITGLFSGQAATNPLVLVIATLAIAALVLPARQRIQLVIDRRFYRRKYDMERTLAAFSDGLRNEVDLEHIQERLITVVQETIQPTYVSLWLARRKRNAAEPAPYADRHNDTPTT